MCSLFLYFQLHHKVKMGKPKKSKKFGHAAAPSKVSLDEQITQGRVAKSKGKMKIRLRAEEEMVS